MDGIRLVVVVVVTGVGEILLMGMQDGGTLSLVDTFESVDDSTYPIRNANDVEVVFTDGQAFLVLAGSQAVTQPNLEGVTLFDIGGGVDVLTGSAANDDILGFDEGDSLSGLGGSDRIYGAKNEDTIRGGAGFDLLGGGLGADLVYGGSGGDEISGGQGADVMDGGLGRDLLSYRDAGGRVNVNLATGAVSGAGAAGDVILNFERVTGSRFADTLTGDSLDNGIYGGDGNDRLNGGAGNDTMNGLVGDDRVFGDAGSDAISGGGGLNLLFGGDGNDRIQFGSGDDYVRGGSGADEFLWVPSAAFLGKIYDFTQGEDVIDLSALHPSILTPETLLGLLQTVGGVHTRLFINGDRGILIRDITVAELTLSDFVF